jgi:superfamily II DNA/RNA helicase
MSGLEDEYDNDRDQFTYHNILMQLRKICNHSYLFLEDIQTIPDETYFKYLLESSGKLFVLDKLIDSLVFQQKSKVLLFSQFTTMLTILEGYLQRKGIQYCRLDGSTDRETRELSISNFQKAPENSLQVFLLSTRAGGVGINLQAADTVILFDSDWNPQQDLQAISRVHRIGQLKPVLILRLLSLGPSEEMISIEEYILNKARRKLVTERKVLHEGEFSPEFSNPTTPSPSKKGGRRGRGDEMCMAPDDWWFQEEEEVESVDSLDKIVTNLFSKKNNKNTHLPHDSCLEKEEDEEEVPPCLEVDLDEDLIQLISRNEKDEYRTFSVNLSWNPVAEEWSPWLNALKIPSEKVTSLSSPVESNNNINSSTHKSSNNVMDRLRQSPRKRRTVQRLSEVLLLDGQEGQGNLDGDDDYDDLDVFPVVKIRMRKKRKACNSLATKAIRSKRKLSAKNSREGDEDDESYVDEEGETMEEEDCWTEEDICCLCQKLWLDENDLSSMEDLFSTEDLFTSNTFVYILDQSLSKYFPLINI